MTEIKNHEPFDPSTGEVDSSFHNYSAGWVDGIWSKWALEKGVVLPVTHSYEILPGDKDHHPALASMEMKQELEHDLSLTLEEYRSQHMGKLPMWATRYSRQNAPHPLLTSSRHKKMVGYMIEKDDFKRDKIWKFFDSGAYLELPGTIGYRQLNRLGTPCLEKELLRSQNKRLLVYRYLNRQGEVVHFVSVRWLRDEIKRNIRVEEYGSEEDMWRIKKEIITRLDGNFEENSQSGTFGFSLNNIDKLVFSI